MAGHLAAQEAGRAGVPTSPRSAVSSLSAPWGQAGLGGVRAKGGVPGLFPSFGVSCGFHGVCRIQ